MIEGLNKCCARSELDYSVSGLFIPFVFAASLLVANW